MIGRVKALLRGILAPARNALSEARAQKHAPFGAKFEQRAPSQANAIDVFSGRWATNLTPLNAEWHGGTADLVDDNRPALAAHHLGNANRLDSMSVLELGPLEGIHSYRLEQLGASVLAIESNVEAYLKCLIMKEALGLRARFMLGDFGLYLRDTDKRFDMVFACGVLYHMEDPLALIRDTARVTDRCFVWTHYYDEARPSDREAVPATVEDFSSTYFRAGYRDRAQAHFWGGNKPTASWMRRDEIIAAFRHFGFDAVEIISDDRNAAHSPTICFTALRTVSPTGLG